MNKVPCSICGIYCSGKMEELVYTKLYPVCKDCFKEHTKTPMKEISKLIKKSSL